MNAAEGPNGGAAKASVGEENDSTSASFAQKFAATLVKSKATDAGDVVACLCHQLLASRGFYVEGAENCGDLPADWKKTAPFYYSIVYRHAASDVRLKLMFCQFAYEGPQTFQVVGHCNKGDSVFTEATVVSSDSIRVSVLSELNSMDYNFDVVQFVSDLLKENLVENVKMRLLDPISHRALGLLQSHGGAAAIGISTSDSFAQKFLATLVKSKATDAGDVVACLCHQLLVSRGFRVEGAENCGDLPANWKKAAPFYYSVAYCHPASDVRLQLTLLLIANEGQTQTFQADGCCMKGDTVVFSKATNVSSDSVRVSVLSEVNSMDYNFDVAQFVSDLLEEGLVENVKAHWLDPISHRALGLLQSHEPGESSTSSGAGPKPLGHPVSAIDPHFHQIDQPSASSVKISKSINQCKAVVRVPAIKTCKMPKKRKLSCPINDLADEVLLRIFKLLPPGERLLASEVCMRWYRLSRIQWHDVTHLELPDISELNHPIVTLCPNLQTVLVPRQWIAVNGLQFFSRTNLSSVKLYDCMANIPPPEYDQDYDIFSRMFSNDLANASWEELVLHDLRVMVERNEYGGYPTSSSLPVSLKRLQLCGIDITDPQLECIHMNVGAPSRFLSDIGHLQNLTCLILTSSSQNILIEYILMEDGYLVRELQKLKSLRELCLGFYDYMPVFTVGFLFNLPRLAVLFLHNIELEVEEEEEFGRLVTQHPSLRILAITGPFPHELFVPARRLYPNGFGSTPVPKLHIFVGKEPSEKILFTKSSEDALKIHPITEPLSSFLAKPEIAPIFKDVWIAAQIKESEEQCEGLYFGGVDAATSFRVADDA